MPRFAFPDKKDNLDIFMDSTLSSPNKIKDEIIHCDVLQKFLLICRSTF